MRGKLHEISVIDKIQNRWREAGIYLLNADHTYLSRVSEENRDDYHRCKQILAEWIKRKGTREYPSTWDGLRTLLEDLDYEEVAGELQEPLIFEGVYC